MTNFDFLKKEPKFDDFSDIAISAERILAIDYAASILNCRRAMEFAVKWMYSVDASLVKPWDDKLVNLIRTEEFRGIVDENLRNRMEFIRKTGNLVAHKRMKMKREQAELCLENLYIFLDFVAYCYADEYTERTYDVSLIKKELDLSTKNQRVAEAERALKEAKNATKETELKLEQLLKENLALREQLTSRREEQKQTYVSKPVDISEYKTRKIYIDTMLQDAGWIENVNWFNEYEVSGMPNKSEVGFADYALCGEDGRVLAVIEAKRTCVDVAKGRQQAKLYADLIEKKQGRRPVVFLTNGFETRIVDNQYPERKVAAIYSKRDLEKLFNLQAMRSDLRYISFDPNIIDRYYQKAAVKAVCDALGVKNRRKALLVMATGSGKTRTVIALCKVLLEQGWIKNVLFLADRNSLVTQAKRSFVNLLPEFSVTNLCEEKENISAHGVFSTYQTMMNCIDEIHDAEGKLFTCGHFDLVICDEAHRSIYNKYRDIFQYFDAPLVGLTATPKDEVDKNTYDIFELEKGVPTYGYELSQAVEDGYLVDFISVETKLKFLEEGIVYDELSPEEKEAYEDTFEDENGILPETIHASALNEWVFNEDTIKEVLHILMTEGRKVDYGNKIGKTIIFAKNHRHAEKIYEIFGKEYPNLKNYANVIDNQTSYVQNAIDEFSDSKKMPQIAISVDMLDTGIDVPEILNLVFFKKVMSKAKFWQMIGRGTRLCPELLDGVDKDKFYIFDFCGNFDFFRIHKEGKEVPNGITVQGAIFQLEFEIAYKLQALEYQTERLKEFRTMLVQHMTGKVNELNRNNFAVRQHLKYVDRFASKCNYDMLTYEDSLDVKRELVPLIEPERDDVKALRFDALLYGIELAVLEGKKYTRGRRELVSKVDALSTVANIPEIQSQGELIHSILRTDYLEGASVEDFEHIRQNLRDLIKYIPKSKGWFVNIDFQDEVLSMEYRESELENDDLKNYKAKAEYYIRKHQDNAVIAKLKSNIPLNVADVKLLEEILWSELGTKEDYEAEYGEKPLGEFVREIVGLDMNAAKNAFAEYLDDTKLDSGQIYFVNQVIEYIVHNGVMKDLSVLQEAPFTDYGSIVELFSDMSLWVGIRKTITQINANALAA